MRWVTPPVDGLLVDRLSQDLSLDPIVSTLLVRLGLIQTRDAQLFLSPKLKALSDPFRITNMDKAVDRLIKAMDAREEIVVFGDYDVDGITSTVFLVEILNHFGVYPRYVVPRRLEEGYGLSKDAIDRMVEDGRPGLLVAVDCGTTSIDEVYYLKELGIDVLIVDHHTPQGGDLPDTVIVNPHVYDAETDPWFDLCSVGLVFKLVHGLLKRLRVQGNAIAHQIDLKDYLDLVAMGTIADLVPLRAENRILSKVGLSCLKDTKRLGLCALYQVVGMTLGVEVSPFDISFKLGPRINASGRLADATVPIDMLLSTNWDRCLRFAEELDGCNRERQTIERAIVEEAIREADIAYQDDPSVVLFNEEWHPGVVGIVASRMVQKYHKPAIIMGAEGGEAKGSGRSVPGIDLVKALSATSDVLNHWGGHPMAVGVSLDVENVSCFRERFNVAVSDVCGASLPEPELIISAWLDQTDLSERLLKDLEQVSPFGQANPEPVFGLRRVTLLEPVSTFGTDHFRFKLALKKGRWISGVAWNQAENPLKMGCLYDLAFKLNWNRWNNRKFPQMILLDHKLVSY